MPVLDLDHPNPQALLWGTMLFPGTDDDRAFVSVRRSKGSKNAQHIDLTKDARAAIDARLEKQGRGTGPLFSTRGGKSMARSKVYDLLKRLEGMAKASSAGKFEEPEG